MQGKSQFLTTAGSIIALLLVIANIGLYTTNRTLQNLVNERAQYIQQSLQLEKIYQPLVRALAELAVGRNDPQIKALLNEQGISFTVNPAAAPQATPAK